MNIWPNADEVEKLKQEWTGKQVVVDDSRPELKRFAGQTGRVVTVNMNGKALVEFQEGRGRYDIDVRFLKEAPAAEPAKSQK